MGVEVYRAECVGIKSGIARVRISSVTLRGGRIPGFRAEIFPRENGVLTNGVMELSKVEANHLNPMLDTYTYSRCS